MAADNMDEWLSPNGAAIQGTLEIVEGAAYLSSLEDDGSYDHAGDTKIYWDGQETRCTADDKPIFIDEEGEQWTFDQLYHVVDTGARSKQFRVERAGKPIGHASSDRGVLALIRRQPRPRQAMTVEDARAEFVKRVAALPKGGEAYEDVEEYALDDATACDTYHALIDAARAIAGGAS